MVEKVADFETSKEIVYLENEKNAKFDEQGHFLLPRKSYRYVEVWNDEKKEYVGKLEPFLYQYKKVDVENSKTWVYHWAIENLDLSEFKEGYDIDSFMDYMESYPEDLIVDFHNEKFDGTFILFYMLKRPTEYKQLIEAKNLSKLVETQKKENVVISAAPMEPFYNYKKPNIEAYNALKHFKRYGIVKRINKVDTSMVDAKIFTSSVNELGIMYSITIYVLKKNRPVHIIEIKDSLKLLNFSVAQLAKDFLNEDLPKLKIDYDVIRPANRPDLLTKEDHEYIKRDIDIVAKCLSLLKTSEDIEGDKNRSTIASIALDDFKTVWAKKVLQKEYVTNKEKNDIFRQTFPLFKTECYDGSYFNDLDDFVRAAYKGGFCYANKIYKTTLDPKGINYSSKGMCCIDVNSLYPYIYYKRPMVYGSPIRVVGKPLEKNGYERVEHIMGEDKKTLYDYYFIRLRVKFKLKMNKIPSIMIKGADIRRNPDCDLPVNEYLEHSNGDFVELIMTKDDYELMLEQYDLFNDKNEIIEEKDIEVKEILYFQTVIGIFDDYVEKWSKIKIEAGKVDNKTRRAIAKLMMNSLFGKFGTKVRTRFKYFYVDGKDKLNALSKIENIDEPIYTPIAACITAAGRRYTIETSQKILDYGLKKYNKYVYCYSDTDSIHTTLCRDDVIECLGDIVDVNKSGELGLWDIEEDNIIKSCFIRTKTYMEERAKPNKKGEILKTGIAGLPAEIQKALTWDAFDKRVVIVGKLQPTQVQGGTALLESTFEIK